MPQQPVHQSWHALSEEILTGMHAWRQQHPKATLREMETEVDARLARLRARMLEDMALQSAAADWEPVHVADQPQCPQCGVPLKPRGKQTRHLQTHGGRELTLERRYGVCPSWQEGFSPLDEELGLLPGSLTPRLQESLTRLGTWIASFDKAAEELAWFTQVEVSKATATRITEAAGAAAVAVQTAAVECIAREYPTPAVWPDTLLVSADGAMCPCARGNV